jgi:hypothetical protein
MEDAMFEQEIEMEKKTSSIVPLLLIVVLIVAVVGVALYFVAESKKVLTAAEASPVVLASLDSQPAPMLRFQTGVIKASVSEKPHDPHYRLLEKEGFLKIGKEDRNYKTAVSLTARGQEFLGEIAGVKQSKDKDGNTQYIVPLAQRKLVEVGKINMLTPSRAAVEYTWKWETTKAGDLFDAAGPAVKAFNTWDRATLIEKYGANFYHHDATKITVAMVKTDKGWQVSTE